jgi:hypothetical protein
MDDLTITCSVFKDVIYVRYLDHVQYSRAHALEMSPQTRETIGWVVYDCEQYIILSSDRDAGPPTLKSGDLKASGLLLLKAAILEMEKLDDTRYVLNIVPPISKDNRISASKAKNSVSPLGENDFHD